MTPYLATNGFLMYYQENSTHTILAEMRRARQADILDCSTSEDAASNVTPIPFDFKVSADVVWKHNLTPLRYMLSQGGINELSECEMLDVCFLARCFGREEPNKQGRYWVTSPAWTLPHSNLIDGEPVSIVLWAPQDWGITSIRYDGLNIIDIAGQ